jgi:hypothetical protein
MNLHYPYTRPPTFRRSRFDQELRNLLLGATPCDLDRQITSTKYLARSKVERLTFPDLEPVAMFDGPLKSRMSALFDFL